MSDPATIAVSPGVEHLVGEKSLGAIDDLVKSTRNHFIKRGLYPKPYRIGPRRKAWKLSEIQAWIASLPLADEVEAQ